LKGMLRRSLIRSSLLLRFAPRLANNSVKLRNYGAGRVMSLAHSERTHLEKTENFPRHKEMTSATVLFCNNLSPSVKTLRLKVMNPNFSFKAGQWVDFIIPGLATVGGFSMTSCPMQLTQSGTLDLAVKYSKYAPAHWIHTECKNGDKVQMKVGGDFFYEPCPSRGQVDLLLIAGGVGINPLYSILTQIEQLHQNGHDTGVRKIVLMYSAKTEAELLFKESIKSAAESVGNVSCQFHITGKNCDIVQSEDKLTSGRITNQHVETALQGLDTNTLLTYLCGPPPMIESLVGTLTGLGQPASRVHYEKWW